MRGNCVFCDYEGPSPILWAYGDDIFVIEPLNPVTPGHTLVLPRAHIPRTTTDSYITGRVFEAAAVWAAVKGDFQHNLIVSSGPAATQTINHLHVHVVPRREGDRLLLPWSSSKEEITP